MQLAAGILLPSLHPQSLQLMMKPGRVRYM